LLLELGSIKFSEIQNLKKYQELLNLNLFGTIILEK